MAIKVLVSGAGGDVAQGVIAALNKSDLDIEIYAICISLYSSWLHKVEKSYLSPLVISSKYIPFLVNFISENNINVFFPCIDSEIKKISENKKLIEQKTNAIVMVDDIEKVDISDDKFKTYEFLKNNGFIYPETCIPSSALEVSEFVKSVGFPIIAKTRNGRGSNDIKIINTYSESRSYIGRNEYVLQEYIHGDDYELTAGIYLDDDDNVISTCVLLRELKCGSTYRAKRILNKDIENYFSSVAQDMGMKYLNIQARLYNNKAYIFEFNGRLSGTTGIISRIFNAPELFIRERILKEKISKIVNDEIFYVMRYWEDVVATKEDMHKLSERSVVKDEEYFGLWM